MATNLDSSAGVLLRSAAKERSTDAVERADARANRNTDRRTSLIQLANGFSGSFISLRVAIENFGPTKAGLVLSSYFASFTLGALRCGRIIERVWHIRAYAAFAGLVVAATAAMPLLIGPLPWLVLRAVIGFGCAGLFITTESWLNAKAEPSERGPVSSVYIVGTFLALAVG